MDTTRLPATRRARAQRRSLLKGVTGLLALLVVTVALLFRPLVAAADGNGDTDKYSLYGASAAVSASFAKATSPAGGNDAWTSLGNSPGKAGALLGFPDANLIEEIGWMFQSMTLGAKSVSMDSLDNLGTQYSGTLGYTQYGATLGALGLDESATGFTNLPRTMMGGSTLLAYVCAGGMDAMMTLPIKLLQILNPFKFFYNAFSAVAPDVANAMVSGDTSGVAGPLRPLVSMMSKLYSTVSGIGWGVALPLFGALTLFAWVVLGKGTGGSALKGILVRLLFIAVGVPVLGLVYSQSLNALSTSGDTGASTAQVVAERYVDFEGWATNTNLAVPDGATVQWNSDQRSPTGLAWENLNNTTLSINNKATGNAFGSKLTSSQTDWEQASYSTEPDGSRAWWAGWNLLWKYTNAEAVSASVYSSTVQAELQKGHSESELNKIFDQLRHNDNTKASEINDNPLVNSGSLTATRNGNGNTVTFNSGAKGLSELGMYNYLTSTFDSDGVDIYGSQISTSLNTMPQHKSVVLAGDTLAGVLNWLSGLVLLGSFAVLGIAYGFGVFMMITQRSLRLFTSIPMAALGSVRAISMVISSVLVMIGGLFTSIFTYLMVKQLLMIIPQMVTAVLGSGGGESPLAGVLVGNTGVVMLVVRLLLVTILVLVFTIAAMRLRKSLMKGLEQIVDGVVDKIMPAPTREAMGVPAASAGGKDGKGSTGNGMFTPHGLAKAGSTLLGSPAGDLTGSSAGKALWGALGPATGTGDAKGGFAGDLLPGKTGDVAGLGSLGVGSSGGQPASTAKAARLATQTVKGAVSGGLRGGATGAVVGGAVGMAKGAANNKAEQGDSVRDSRLRGFGMDPSGAQGQGTARGAMAGAPQDASVLNMPARGKLGEPGKQAPSGTPKRAVPQEPKRRNTPPGPAWEGGQLRRQPKPPAPAAVPAGVQPAKRAVQSKALRVGQEAVRRIMSNK